MKFITGFALTLLAVAGSLKAVECTCSAPSANSAAVSLAPASSEVAAPSQVGHPLRGIILELLPEKNALLVKHEEIPGVMRAMTMLLKVDAATLKAAKKNQAITATLVRLDDGWWLRDLVPVPPAL